jgi:hypothetical protein
MPTLEDLNYHHTMMEAAVREIIQRHGWHILEVVYHNGGVGDTRLLRRASDPTALYVRTMPDMVVTNGQRTLLLEVKTHISGRYSDATPELLPIVAARALSQIGVEILYIYEDPKAGISAAWRCNDLFTHIPVRAIYIGTQRPEWKRNREMVCQWQNSGLIPQNIKVVTTRTGGSGDPYVIIPEYQLRRLPPWPEVLERVLCG